MSSRDQRHAAKRKALRSEAKRNKVDRTGPGVSLGDVADAFKNAGGITTPGYRMHESELDAIAKVPGTEREHDSACQWMHTGQCLDTCESDAQLRARLQQDRFG